LATASLAIKILRDEQPQLLHGKLIETLYQNRRTPSIGHFYNNANGKIGKQSFQNRLQHVDQITRGWLGKDWTSDMIRTNLKATYFRTALN